MARFKKNSIALLASVGVGITMTLLYFADFIGMFAAIMLALLFSAAANYLFLGKEGDKSKPKTPKKK